MCAAAKSDPETAYRVHGHFRGAIWGPLSLTLYSVLCTAYAARAVARLGGMSNAKRCWREPPKLSAPKVPFLNSALPEECPVCLYWQSGSMAPHSAGSTRHVPAPNRPHTRYRDAQAHPWQG